MADPTEPRNKTLTVKVTATELKALEFLQRIHPDRFDGISPVVREYSLDEALKTYELAQATAGA